MSKFDVFYKLDTEELDTGAYTLYRNKEYVCRIHESVKVCCLGEELQKAYNAIVNYLSTHEPNYVFSFVYTNDNEALPEDFVDVRKLLYDYPQNYVQKLERIIKTLVRLYPNPSDRFNETDLCSQPRLFYIEKDCKTEVEVKKEVRAIVLLLEEEGYLNVIPGPISGAYTIHLTMKAYKLADMVSKNPSKQIFIAMSFKDLNELQDIEMAFKAAINNCGYKDQIIKDKEHNNYIMPEIFSEIDKSAAVVVDVTYENAGAYYEAGYATGKGKEVIICCKREVFDDANRKPHFDIIQRSIVLWDTIEDLKNKLEKRIKATLQQ